MVAGINGASNSPANKKKTKDYDPSTGEMKTAWSPAPPKKEKKKTESLIERLKRQKEEKERLIEMM